MFSKQPMFCCICGKETRRHIQAPYGMDVCGKECFEEHEWRKVLSIQGKEYYPRTTKEIGDE